MGTKLHQDNNLFTTLQKNNCNVVIIGLKTSDIRAVSDNISLKVSINLAGLNQLKGSMERLMECYDRNSLRNAMLKHEETFSQQLHELHRLYRVQKMLMAELGNKQVNLNSFPSETATAIGDTRTRIRSSASTSDTSHSSHISNVHHSAAQLNSEYSSLNPCSTRAGPSSRDQRSIFSKGPSSVHIKRFDLEQPAREYTSGEATSVNNHTNIHANHWRESWTGDGSEIELTLSIGCSSDKNKKKPTHWLHRNSDSSDNGSLLLSRPVRQENEEECGDSSSGLDRENLKSAPWLLQAFNLNKT